MKPVSFWPPACPSLTFCGFSSFHFILSPQAHPASCLYVTLTCADPFCPGLYSEQIPHLDPLAQEGPHPAGPPGILHTTQHPHMLTPMIVCQC